MPLFPRIELDIREDKTILPAKPDDIQLPWREVVFVKFCVDHSINVFSPTEKYQSFAGVETRLCEHHPRVTIGPVSNSLFTPLDVFTSHDAVEEYFLGALGFFGVHIEPGTRQSDELESDDELDELESFTIPADQGKRITDKFSSELKLMAFDAAANDRKMVSLVVEIRIEIWMEFYPGIYEESIADYVLDMAEVGSRTQYSAVQLMKRFELESSCFLEEEECSICLEILGGQRVGMELPCSHIYHLDCILDWLIELGKASCPMCRARTG